MGVPASPLDQTDPELSPEDADLYWDRCVNPHCRARKLRLYTWMQRRDLRDRFHRHAGHGLCHLCYNRATRAGTLPNPPPPLEQQPVDHGSVRGYRWHLRNKVEQCEPCRKAAREHRRTKYLERTGQVVVTPRPAPVRRPTHIKTQPDGRRERVRTARGDERRLPAGKLRENTPAEKLRAAAQIAVQSHLSLDDRDAILTALGLPYQMHRPGQSGNELAS